MIIYLAVRPVKLENGSVLGNDTKQGCVWGRAHAKRLKPVAMLLNCHLRPGGNIPE
jgi:hypothetical protein